MARFLLPAMLLLAGSGAAARDPPADNAEMAAIYAADQTPRQGGPIDWEAVGAADAERRARTRALIEQGALTTARDYYHAAFVFQHGNEPDDFLLAHVLAVRALASGMAEAEQVAAATLDRYLQHIDRAQVYGTQVSYSPESGASAEPFDRALVPDALRRAMGAPTVAELDAGLARSEAQLKATLPARPNP